MDESRAILDALPVLRLLPPDLRHLVARTFVPVSFPFGAEIVREGEKADALYVLVSGRARVVRRGEGGEEISLNTLRPGDSFGEIALLERTARTATVRASAEVTALKLDRAVFEALLETRPELKEYLELQARHRSLHNFFRQFTPFARLPVDALRMMLDELELLTTDAGTLVIRQGDEPGPMYVVEDGRLRVFTEADGRRRPLAYLRKGDFFGELSVLKGIARTASVEAVSPCRLLALHPDTVRKLLIEYPEFKAQIEARIAQYDYKGIARVPLDFQEEILPADASAPDAVSPDQVHLVAGEEEEETFVRRRKRIRRFPHVQQIDEMDCGAACLAMVCRHFGRSVSLARIRQLAHTGVDGTSLRGLCRAATELGLAARSVKATPRHLGALPLPAIVHWEGNHWVVLWDVDERHARIADPAFGPRRLARADFEARWTGYAALFDYTEAFRLAPEAEASWAWLGRFVRPFAGLVAKAVALALIVSSLQMLLPVFTQVVVDKVLVEQDADLLRVLVLAMIAAMLFSVVALVVQRYLLSFVAVHVDSASLDFLTQRLLTLPMTYFTTRRTGDIQRRLAGLRHVREFLVEHGVTALTAAVQLVVALGLMVAYSPFLALVFLATAPLYAVLMRLSSRWLRPIFDELEEGFGKYQSHQIDAIKGIETVKALGAEDGLRQAMLGQFHAIARRVFRADFTVLCYDGFVQTVTFLSAALFLWVGARQVMAGHLTLGGLVAFNALVAMANAPLASLLHLWDNLQLVSVLMRRIEDVLAQEPEQGADRARLAPVRTLEGRVSVRGLGFRYGGPESTAVLDGLTFDVPAGTTVAIVGRSGSGKTTLVKCLAALLEPTEGAICYDGVDLRTVNHRDLRRLVGFVLQDNHLFDDTIARNIAFGEPEPDLDRVLWAARAANAHDFIERLPLGYETRVGETGLAVSGGQRQRVAIARALYHQPPVLIFDEATSALDSESERAVKENIAELLEGRTAFVIAHRLSTVRDADVILVLERGRLVERGGHDELMARQGLYFYLASQQLEL